MDQEEEKVRGGAGQDVGCTSPLADRHYLRLLSRSYPDIQSAATEVINLTAVLNLPKGTEHFLSDLHGEHEAFLHMLKNGSGVIAEKINLIFGESMPEAEKRELATLIYYPDEKMAALADTLSEPEGWYRDVLFKLVRICRVVASKYTRSKVRKSLPRSFSYIIEELLHENEYETNKQAYYLSIIDTIISTGRAAAFITAISELIQRLSVDRLHIIGDIFDRGPGAHIIVDHLMNYHQVDVQWGNHDILWMGAAGGSKACIANAVRMSLRYGNVETLEDGYGISLLPLATFAMDVYGADECARFAPHGDRQRFSESEIQLMARMHKAISIIQFKLEAQVIKRRPQYQMEHRLLLDKMDISRGIVRIGERDYPLLDTCWPTLDPDDPCQLTEGEQTVVNRLLVSFRGSDRLQQHVRFLFSHGSMYRIINGNLLYHGCISMNRDGTFREFAVDGKRYAGRRFMDRVERLARQGFFAQNDPEAREYGLDAMWYLWSGDLSPLFGKDKMATFERYFVADPDTHVENKDYYYEVRDDETVCGAILEEFGLDPETAHIINGHVPVKVKKGESPIKAGGRMIVIDGGLSKAYQQETGIAGYTLICNSHGMRLVSHRPFVSRQKAIEENLDIHSTTVILETSDDRIRIKNTNTGRSIQHRIDDLRALLAAYRSGVVKTR
jgi:fructose-1,6-bisphosphatase-3